MRKGHIGIVIAIFFGMTFWMMAAGTAQNYEILSKSKNPEEIVSALKERLQLSQDQEEKVRSVIMGDFEKRNELKKKYSKDSNDELALLIEQRRLKKETEGKIVAILTEDQMAAYELFKKEYLSKAQREARSKITDETILIMKERLQLTEEQADIVLPIIDQGMKERQALIQKMGGAGGPGGGPGGDRGNMSAMRGMREEMERIDERTEERLSKVLTEEQMVEYRKIKKDERDKMREIMRERMGGRGGRGGGRRGGGGR